VSAEGFYFVFVRMYKLWMEPKGGADVFRLNDECSGVGEDSRRIRYGDSVDVLILCLVDDPLWIFVKIDVTMRIHESTNAFLRACSSRRLPQKLFYFIHSACKDASQGGHFSRIHGAGTHDFTGDLKG